MLFYMTDHSLYCSKIRIMLRHKKLTFEEALPPGGGGSREYLSLVPSGNIPALVEGPRTLTDSEAIAEYLEEKYPEIPMLPDTLMGRAQSRERSRFSDTRLEPALRLTFPHVDPRTRDPEAIAQAHAIIQMRLIGLGHLFDRSDLDRTRLWMGDLGTIVTLEWIALFEGNVIPTLEWPETVQAYLDEMHKQPAVSDEMHAYRPKMLHYMREKGAI